MKMLHWFPTPYPDELLYSVFARYHVRSGNTSPKMTIEDLYGKRTIRSVLDLPSNLNVLLSRMGSNWDVESLIFNHTMFAYHAPYLLPQQSEQVKQSMMGDSGSTIHTRIGITASNVKKKMNLWVCSECMEMDMSLYGETYWRRIHQAPGVFICPKHEGKLEETIVSVKTKNQHEFVIATPLIERTRVNLDELRKEELQLLLKIAQITEILLTKNLLQAQDNTIREKYLLLLKQKGYASLNGFVKRDKLYRSFRAKFSDRLLDLLQSSLSYDESDWLTKIFRKHRRSFHPVRHMLVMLFLDADLNLLLSQDTYLPFGQGPWLCLNVACSNYHQPVVSKLTTTNCYDTGKPVGTFCCDCGFIFSRRGPDKNSTDRYLIGTIKNYGEVWKARLTELVNEGKTLTEVANELKADRATVKKYAAELELTVPWKAPKVQNKDPKAIMEEYEIQLEGRKNRWLELQGLYSNKSKTELRRIAPDVFTFLYRNDLEWLNANSPVKKRVQIPNKRVDWEKRDKELLESVKVFLNKWDLNTERLTKITITSIGKKLNKLALLQKKADKLPLTMNYIREAAENTVSFQKRRVAFRMRKSKEENEQILEWKIYRKAGLRSTVSNDVKRFISLKVSEYDSVK